ncbi:MAG: hypothetical protein AB1664_00695 [Thermodesulfobacteriota bacterium]
METMKRLLFVLVLVLMAVPSLRANDYAFSHTRTIAAADTLADSIRVDTTYDEQWIDLRGRTQFNFWYGLYGTASDSDFTADTFFVKLQHGPRYATATDSRVIDLATFTTIGDSLVWSTFEWLRADSVIGNWGRLMVIHQDSNEADIGELLGNSYKYDVQVWITEIK